MATPHTDRDIAFTKMHGLGNDFIVIDARGQEHHLTSSEASFLADRHYGVGCDQVLVLLDDPHVDARLVIYNPDGSLSNTCGNGVRCVGSYLHREKVPPYRLGHPADPRVGVSAIEESSETVIGIRSGKRIIRVWPRGDHWSADMGTASFATSEIGLTEPIDDPMHLGLNLNETLKDGAAVSMGNPHVVFFVPDLDQIDLARLGPQISANPLFENGVNVGVATVVSPTHLRLRVHERGAGLTLACASGASAATVVAQKLGFVEHAITVSLPGGDLHVQTGKTGAITQTGPCSTSFQGFCRIRS